MKYNLKPILSYSSFKFIILGVPKISTPSCVDILENIKYIYHQTSRVGWVHEAQKLNKVNQVSKCLLNLYKIQLIQKRKVQLKFWCVIYQIWTICWKDIDIILITYKLQEQWAYFPKICFPTFFLQENVSKKIKRS